MSEYIDTNLTLFVPVWQVGTHAELMATGKYYKELIRRQTVLD